MSELEDVQARIVARRAELTRLNAAQAADIQMAINLRRSTEVEAVLGSAVRIPPEEIVEMVALPASCRQAIAAILGNCCVDDREWGGDRS